MLLTSAIASAFISYPFGCTFASIVSLVAAVYILGTRTFGFFHALNIPSVADPVPWLGHSLLYTRCGGYKNDERLSAKYGKVFGMFEGRNPVLIVADAKGIYEILVSKFDCFTQRRTLTTVRVPLPEAIRHTVIGQSRNGWRRHRRSFKPIFNAMNINQYSSEMVQCSRRLVAGIESQIKESGLENARIEMKYATSAYTLDVLLSTIFASAVEDSELRDEYVRHSRAIFNTLSFKTNDHLLFQAFPLLPGLLERVGVSFMNSETYKFYWEQIGRRLTVERTADESKGHGLLHDGHAQMSKTELIGNAMLFMLSSAEVPSTVIYWCMYLLTLNPEVQTRLQEEVDDVWTDDELPTTVLARMPYLDMVMSEVLRLYPPAQRIDVVCNKTTKLIGESIEVPAETEVCYSIWAVHHDPEYWPNPYSFDPERFSPLNRPLITPGSYVPFGLGPRFCIGKRYAQAEEKLAIVHLLRRFSFSAAFTDVPVVGSPASDTKDMMINVHLRPQL